FSSFVAPFGWEQSVKQGSAETHTVERMAHASRRIMNSCPLCGSEAIRELKLSHTEIWKCRANNCRLEFASPQPEDHVLERAYRTLLIPQRAIATQLCTRALLILCFARFFH